MHVYPLKLRRCKPRGGLSSDITCVISAGHWCIKFGQHTTRSYVTLKIDPRGCLPDSFRCKSGSADASRSSRMQPSRRQIERRYVIIQVEMQDQDILRYAQAACTALQSIFTSEGATGEPLVHTSSLRRLQGGTPSSVENSLDVMFILICSVLVFLMQAGFAMVRCCDAWHQVAAQLELIALVSYTPTPYHSHHWKLSSGVLKRHVCAQLCGGSVRSKNTLNILIKNVVDGCAGALAFYFVGYGIAYGTAEDGSGNAFIGSNDFFLTQTSKSGTWHVWLFQWAFAAATATIVSGSVAERCTFEAYLGYSFYLSALVYPTVAHWHAPRCGFVAATANMLIHYNILGCSSTAGCPST